MAETPSTMLALGTRAPGFRLPNRNPDVGGAVVTLEDYAGAPALLVAFICNHCPYVVHLRDALCDFAREFAAQGLATVAVSANDAGRYPDDAPEKMTAHAKRYKFPFAYLYDAGQDTAKAYRAACTPDFFLFDGGGALVYRGRFDGSSPGNNVALSGGDLRAAVEATLAGRKPAAEQLPSLGCSIKWKAGNEPDYF